MTDTYSKLTRTPARSITLDTDVASIVVRGRGNHAVDVVDPCGQDVPITAGPQRELSRLLERFGPVLGVGDAIWRVLSTVSAEIVCIALQGPLEPAQIERLVQPFVEDPGLMLVSGVDEPPPRCGQPGGDRLTELVAKPLVARYEPALAGLRQPLLASFAARRSLLRAVHFPVGAGMRLSLLIDAILDHGSDAVAEVVLEGRLTDDQPLRELGGDAAELIVALRRRSAPTRMVADERLVQPWNDLSRTALRTDERPPLDSILVDYDPRAPMVDVGLRGRAQLFQ